jgi:hypothetical protein
MGVAGWNITTDSSVDGLAHCWVLRRHPFCGVVFSGCSWPGPSNACPSVMGVRVVVVDVGWGVVVC